MHNKSYSEHIFLFPFSWKYKIPNKKDSFTRYYHMNESIFNQLENWQEEFFSMDTDKAYNEFVYFYKAVRMALYTFKEQVPIVRNYYYRFLTKENYFSIQIEKRTYTLAMEDIRLKIYKTGIGILSFHLMNNRYEDPSDIMYINSFSKCIHPPSLPLSKAKEELFPDKITIQLAPGKIIEETFEENYKTQPIPVASLLLQILGEPFTDGRTVFLKPFLWIEPILGSQMFCINLYNNEDLLEQLKKGTMDLETIEKFVLINKKTAFQETYSVTATNAVEYLQDEMHFYGISQFSLMGIAKFPLVAKVYDQLASLAVMQRATLLALSNEIAIVSTLPKDSISPAIQIIYKIYIQFVNQLYFKEVTQDAQGLQIYAKLTKQLRIEEELKQLNFEMDEVREYASLLDQSQSKFRANVLTIIGAALVLPTFATGFFGMNIFKQEILTWWTNKRVLLWLNSYVLLPILVTILLYSWGNGRTRKRWFINIIVLLAVLISMWFLIRSGCGL